MPWLVFTRNWSFKPTPMSTIDYKAGHVCNVTRACAAQALAKGVARERDVAKPATKSKAKGGDDAG